MHETHPLEIDVEQVRLRLDRDDIVLIDCREPSEWDTARIEKAVLMPMSQWQEQSEKLVDFEGQHLVVHCHHGGRSLRVTQWLRENGFPEAQNMVGGIDAWSQVIDSSVPRY